MNRNFASHLLALLLVILFVDFSIAQRYIDKLVYTDKDVVVKDKKLYVKGREFIVKGMAYNPVPLGQMTEGGGGLCSAKKTAFDEYKTACFGSDYFDGVYSNPNRYPAGPSGPWWKAAWDRDFPVMKELGVNTVRVYNLNPITKTFLQKYPNEFSGTVLAYAAEHRPFLDHAAANGMKVMIPVVADQTFLENSDLDRISRFVQAIVDELGNHEALLMWVVTNEVNLINSPPLLTKVNFAMDYLRNYTLAKWNRLIPTTTAVVDDPTTYEFYAQNLRVDLFTTNAGYRSVYLDTLFEPEAQAPGWKALSNAYNLPLLIGESGMHQVGDAETQVRPNWVNQQYKQILNRVQDGCIGLVYFEYSDEPVKPLEQQTMGFVSFSAATDASTGKSSTEPNVWVPDVFNRKPIVFQSLKEGLPNDSEFGRWNFNTNEFELLGRSPSAIPVRQTDEPTPTPTPKPSPRKSSPTVVKPSPTIPKPVISKPIPKTSKAITPQVSKPVPKPTTNSATSVSTVLFPILSLCLWIMIL